MHLPFRTPIRSATPRPSNPSRIVQCVSHIEIILTTSALHHWNLCAKPRRLNGNIYALQSQPSCATWLATKGDPWPLALTISGLPFHGGLGGGDGTNPIRSNLAVIGSLPSLMMKWTWLPSKSQPWLQYFCVAHFSSCATSETLCYKLCRTGVLAIPPQRAIHTSTAALALTFYWARAFSAAGCHLVPVTPHTVASNHLQAHSCGSTGTALWSVLLKAMKLVAAKHFILLVFGDSL